MVRNRKHVIIYGTNVAGLRAAANFGKAGYSVLLLNEGRFLGDIKNLFLTLSPRNICNTCLRFFLNRLPLVEIWHNAEVLALENSSDGVKVKIKHAPQVVDETKCFECHKCVGKGIKYVPRSLGGIYLKEDGADLTEAAKLCPVKAINPDPEPIEEEIEADVFIIATEFGTAYEVMEKYGYGKIANVISLKEAEMMIFGGKTVKEAFTKPDGTMYKKIAFVSPYSLDDEGYTDYYHYFTLLRTAIDFKEFNKEIEIDVYINLPNLYGKGHIKLLKEAQETGINIIWSEAKIEEGPKVNGKDYDLVVLSLQESASERLKELSEKIGIELDESGYVKTSRGFETSKNRVFVIGEAHDTKPILDSLYEGAAIVIEAGEYLSEPIKMQMPKMEFPNYDEVEELKVGVALCKCGVEYQGIGIEELKKEIAGEFDAITVIDYACLPEGQAKLQAFIKNNGLHRLVIGACSPFLRQPVLYQAVAKAGLDPVYVDIAQLREFGKSAKVQARLIGFSKTKVLDRKQYPMPRDSYDNRTLIYGTSTAGLSAALSIARAGYPVLVLSGTSIKPETRMQELLLNKLKDNEKVRFLENVELETLEGYAGHFTVSFRQGDKIYKEQVGAILFAPSVVPKIEASDFEVNRIGLICGEIRAGRTSTSRASCVKAIEFAKELKKKGKEVIIATPITCVHGRFKRELRGLMEEGIKLVLVGFEEDPEEKLKEAGAESIIRVLVNVEEHRKAGVILGFKFNEDGYVSFLEDPYDEVNIKLRPHDLGSKGLFVAGNIHRPMTEEDEIIDGKSQAYNILQLVSKPFIMPHPEAGRFVSYTNYRKCAGCGLCVEACEYGARFIDPEEKVAKVREVLCDGCAACVNACPSGAAEVRAWETKTMLKLINEALK